MMLGRDSLHSRSYARKYKKRSKALLWFICFFIVLLFVGSWWVTDKSPFVIKQINIEGVSAISTEDIENVARQGLDGRLLIWSKNNFFLAPREQIEKSLKENFPMIKKVQVEIKGISTLLVQAEEYESNYLVCSRDDMDRCFLSDGTGYIFAPAIIESSTGYTRFITNLPEEAVGSRILPKNIFSKLVEFKEALSDSSLHVNSISINGEKDVRLRIDEGTDIIIDLQENMDEMLGNFLLLLAKETEKNESREIFLRNTEYIDVRYGNKVFYKTHGQDAL